MAANVKRRTNLNSLWSVFYCLLVIAVHIYITYSGIAKYNKFNQDSLWGDSTPGALRAYLALIILSILFLPLFVFTSVLKVGNCANDGTKLGRDHALDCSNTTTLASKIKCDWLKRLWEKFPPFSPVLHLLVAFLVLLPEVVLNAAEVKHGLRLSGRYLKLFTLFTGRRLGELLKLLNFCEMVLKENNGCPSFNYCPRFERLWKASKLLCMYRHFKNGSI